MSEASEKFKKNKDKYIKAFADAVAKPKQSAPKNKIKLETLIYLGLIGTMAPVHAGIAFFSFVALISAAIYSGLAWYGLAHIKKSTYILSSALVVVSILSGCSPLFFNSQNQEIINLIEEREYKYYSMSKVGVFGLGLNDLTIQNARYEGDIETVFVAKLEHGYGIVSISRITVAGK